MYIFMYHSPKLNKLSDTEKPTAFNGKQLIRRRIISINRKLDPSTGNNTDKLQVFNRFHKKLLKNGIT